MSNIIPIVSSSPPPLDDGNFDWNEDEDDFGHFASAPNEIMVASEPDFEVHWPTNELPIPSIESDTVASGHAPTVGDLADNNQAALSVTLNNNKNDQTASSLLHKSDGIPSQDSGAIEDGLCHNENDLTFELSSNSGNKRINDDCEQESLSSNSSFHAVTAEGDSPHTIGAVNNESVHSNASTADSGVFSTDLSPAPLANGSHEVCQPMGGDQNMDDNDECEQRTEENCDLTKSEKLCMESVHDKHSDIGEPTSVSDSCQVAEENDNDWNDFSTAFSDGVPVQNIPSEIQPPSDCTNNIPSQQNSDQEEVTEQFSRSPCISQDNNSNTDHSSPVSDFQRDDDEAGANSEGSEAEQIEEEEKTVWHDFNVAFSKSDEGDDTVKDKKLGASLESSEVCVTLSDDNTKSSHSLSSEKVCLEKSDSFVPDVTEVNTLEDKQLCSGSISSETSDSSEKYICEENIPEVEKEEEDKEFGDFSSCRDRKESDPHEEVAPITFRTSICEPDDEELTFDDNNAEDSYGEYGASGKMSDLDDDDFGDFGSSDQQHFVGASEAATDFSNSKEEAEEATGWADFDAGGAPGEAFDDFGTFKTTEPVPAAQSQQLSKPHKVEKAVLSAFPCDNSSHMSEAAVSDMNAGPSQDSALSPLDTVMELGLTNQEEAKQQTWMVVQHPAKKDPRVRLWTHLKDVDSSHALSLGWLSSHCSKEVFSTLHIDTQNVLFTQKKQAVPFFSSGLSILEPIRGGLDNKKEKGNKTHAPPLLETTTQERAPAAPLQDIPPVDFDWSSSGLTNPLTVFRTDSQNSSQQGLQPLEEILKRSTPTAKLATHEVLSPEATRILEKMPNLSFMQSKVLMFPVKQ